MPETIVDLGRKTKLKYPGEYDDLDDAEVGRKVKAKYPGDYDDFTDVAAASAKPAVPPDTGFKNPILRAAGDFTFGAAKTGAMDMLRFGELLSDLNPLHQISKRFGLAPDGPKLSERPAVKSFLTPPPGLASGIGQFATTAAEFMLPGGLPLKGATKIAALTANAPKLVSKLAPPVARIAGEGATAAVVETARTGGDIEQAKQAGILGAAVPAGLTAAKLPLKLVKEVLGKSTSAGAEALQVAATTASSKYKDAMRGGIAATEIVDDMLASIRTLRGTRKAEYDARMLALDPTFTHAKLPVSSAFDDALVEFEIGIKPGSAHGVPPTLDFSQSPLRTSLNEADVSHINEAFVEMQRLPNMVSTKALNTFKKIIYDFAEASSGKVAPLFNQIGSGVKSELDKAPGFSAVNNAYEAASARIKRFETEFSLHSKDTNYGSVIRKLSYAFNQNNDYRKMLIEIVDQAAPGELKEAIAGYAMRNFLPRGLQGIALSSLPLMGSAAFANPALLWGLLLSSPRAMGETLALLSTLKRSSPNLAPLAPALGSQFSPPTQLSPPR
jgi:hypothetical protein